MKTLSIAVAVAAILVSAPLAQAAVYLPGGWAQPEALGTESHPLRAYNPYTSSRSGRMDYGTTYTGRGTATGGPSGGFPDQP